MADAAATGARLWVKRYNGPGKSCWAISVGTNADRMTTVTSSVYRALSMRWWVSPYSAARARR